MPNLSRIFGAATLATLACKTTPCASGGAKAPVADTGAATGTGALVGECVAHQAVAEGLERRAARDAKSYRIGKLLDASEMLPAIDDARARLRACKGASKDSGQKRTVLPSGTTGVTNTAEHAPIDDGQEDLSKTDASASTPPVDVEDAALDPDAARSVGEPIRVKFLDGLPAGRDDVMRIADEWTRCAETGLRFNYYDEAGKPLSAGAPAATEFEVRVSFKGSGYWSYIGRKIPSDVAATAPTMQLGGLDAAGVKPETRARKVLHEFGHAVGVRHEHQRKEVIGCIDEQRAIDYYARPPNFWGAATTRKNLLTPLPDDTALSTKYDYDSIMNYVIPREILKRGRCESSELPRAVTKLSAKDCEMIAYFYPSSPAVTGPPQAQVGQPFVTSSKPYGSVRFGRQYYEWTIKPNGLDLAKIAAITYDMEPFFRPEVRTSSTGFEVSRKTWGIFPITITVKYKDGGREQDYVYYPELGESVAEKPSGTRRRAGAP